MDDRTALDRLRTGLAKLQAKRIAWDRRERYYRGDQDLPFAPDGVNAEYLRLQKMSIANWVEIAVNAPLQRLRVDGFRTGPDAEADRNTWVNTWQANKLDARQRIVYQQMYVHGRGVESVWPNPANPLQPVVRPETDRRVHLEMDPDDPFTRAWAVKTWERDDVRLGGAGVVASALTRSIAVVHDAEEWVRFETGGNTFSTSWVITDRGRNPLGRVPFVPFDLAVDADGVPHSGIDALLQPQDAINTIRFNTLLAMQFSAFRQRVFVGFDPVIRDENGNPKWKRNADGSLMLDPVGQPIPMLTDIGRVGVDRALVFPGKDTKVFDLPESNLSNYIEVLGEFLTDFFAIGQVPPQYLLTRMANLSGDALAGAESTLASLVRDLQTACADGHEEVNYLAARARGDASDEPVAAETIWGDGEARSFAQIVDAITKLIATGFPRRAAWEMIPGATQTKVQTWIDEAKKEQADPIVAAVLASAPPELPAGSGTASEVVPEDAGAAAGG